MVSSKVERERVVTGSVEEEYSRVFLTGFRGVGQCQLGFTSATKAVDGKDSLLVGGFGEMGRYLVNDCFPSGEKVYGEVGHFKIVPVGV